MTRQFSFLQPLFSLFFSLIALSCEGQRSSIVATTWESDIPLPDDRGRMPL